MIQIFTQRIEATSVHPILDYFHLYSWSKSKLVFKWKKQRIRRISTQYGIKISHEIIKIIINEAFSMTLKRKSFILFIRDK